MTAVILRTALSTIDATGFSLPTGSQGLLLHRVIQQGGNPTLLTSSLEASPSEWCSLTSLCTPNLDGARDSDLLLEINSVFGHSIKILKKETELGTALKLTEP